ncbi:hypothetical protein OSTOST_03731 [Ostertagia ostertagi]
MASGASHDRERAGGTIRVVNAAVADAASKNEQHSDKETVARDTPVQGGIDRLADEPPRMLHMEVNGKKIPFELDTGASLSIIDEKTWHKLGRPQLQKAEVAATAFDNKRITFQGKVPLHIKFAGKGGDGGCTCIQGGESLLVWKRHD